MEQESITAKILALNKTKAAKLGNLVFCIEEKENLIRKSWLNFEEYTHISTEQYCVMVVYEWLNYQNWHGADKAIYYHFEIFLEQLENQLSLSEVADIVRKAKEIYWHPTNLSLKIVES